MGFQAKFIESKQPTSGSNYCDDTVKDCYADGGLTNVTSLMFKEPDRIAMGEPLATEQGAGARGQWDITILEALAAAYLQLHARAVGPADLKIDACADP